MTALATVVTLCSIHLFKRQFLCEHNDLHMFSFLFVVTPKWFHLLGALLSHIFPNTHVSKALTAQHIFCGSQMMLFAMEAFSARCSHDLTESVHALPSFLSDEPLRLTITTMNMTEHQATVLEVRLSKKTNVLLI